MLTPGRIAEIMHEYRRVDGEDFVKKNTITFDEAHERCKKYISRNTKKSYALKEDVDARVESERLIDNFVNTLPDVVEGFEDDIERLRKELKDEIIKYKAITDLAEDPTVDEIRINSINTIIYEQKGKTKHWHKQFKSKEDLEKVLDRLITDSTKRLSKATPFINSRTPEGWRINATDKSISPINDYTAVIRKFRKKEDKMGLTDIIEGRTLSDNMGNLLSLIPRARFPFLTVGGTGSGKTVTNEIILNSIRPMDRQVYIENPCELTPGIELGRIEIQACGDIAYILKDLAETGDIRWYVFDRPDKEGDGGVVGNFSVYVVKDKLDYVCKVLNDGVKSMIYTIMVERETGVYANDFIQLQANSDKKDPTASDPTPNNLVENALRQTPVWIILGETRSDEEFQVLLKAAQTGHIVATTYHADDPEDAIRRYLTAYMSVASNVPAELALQNICHAFGFIINVAKLDDGSRKVMAITEILGSEGLKPILNTIYEFDIERVDENGRIIGKHRRVNALSTKSIRRFRKSGIPDRQYEIYTKEPTDDEVETYLGVY